MTEYIAPKLDSFHFGIGVCACCLDRIQTRGEVIRKRLKAPIADKEKVLTPAGSHHFHRKCWDSLVKAMKENGCTIQVQ